MIVFLLTSGQNYQQSSYCKTNPTSSGVQLECSMTETPSWAHWFVASVPRFSSHGVTGACFVFLLPMKKSPAGIQEVSTQTPRSATRHWNNVNLQQKYAKIIIKDLFRVNKHSGRRALEDRWDILFRLTRCWKKLPLFQSGLHLFPPPPPSPPLEVENTNLRSVYSGTVVLLWPPAVWSNTAWHHHHCCLSDWSTAAAHFGEILLFVFLQTSTHMSVRNTKLYQLLGEIIWELPFYTLSIKKSIN